MIRLNLHYFYNVGVVLQPLKQLATGQRKIDVYPQLLTALGEVRGLIASRAMPLRTCHDAGERLVEAIETITESDFEAVPDLTWFDAFSVTSKLETFETILSAELQILDSYFVVQKGGYSTLDLVEYGESLLPQEILAGMPDGAIADFKQGCRCLAFELSTAVGFHLFRAMEAVIHAYYDAVKVRDSIAPDSTMGQYIGNLRSNGGDRKVLAVLSQITSLHRNPLIHPEDTLTVNQALILVGIVSSAIVAMVEGIQAKRAMVPAVRVAPPVIATPPSAPSAATAATAVAPEDET